jgi:hypothetical protein
LRTGLRKKPKTRRIVVLMMLSASIPFSGLTAAGASTAGPARMTAGAGRLAITPSTSGGEVLCAAKGTASICVTDKNGNQSVNAIVSGSVRTLNPNQHWDLVLASACGGHVSSANTCPFAPGSGLNAEFNGDAIITICLDGAPSLCIANDNGNVATLQHPTATGTNWILSGYSIINRFISDLAKKPQYLTTDLMAGDELTTVSFVQENSQWGLPSQAPPG